MSGAIPIAVVVVPLASAVLLAVVASWRIAVWINAGSASLQFLVACALMWHAHVAAAHLVLLTAFVAMTTSWFGRRDIAAALTARSLNRRRARFYHGGFQALIGAIQAATLAGNANLSWVALLVAVGAAATVIGAARGSAATVSRLVQLCAVGLLLALLGTLLLEVAPDAAGLLVLVGYGALAGLLPLNAWLVAAAAESVAPGALIVTTLLPNAPLMLLMRVPIAPPWPMVFGLVTLLPCAIALWSRLDWRRVVAIAGMAQIGMVVFAIGAGAKPIAWLHLTLLALARSAVLQSQGNDLVAWLAFALLPFYALWLLADATIAVAAWLMVPLTAGAVVAGWALLARRPAGVRSDWIAATPAWLQIAIVVVLAFAMPAPVVAWFRAVAAG